MTTNDTAPVSIFISAEEWRDISQWMHLSLERTEHSPYGHFLLECNGPRRTWVTSDGAQTTVMRTDGPAPRGLPDPNSLFSVLVNSRFFRHSAPQDATLTITDHENGRIQTFTVDGVEITLPEHPSDFGDWRAVLSAVNGTPVDIETKPLREACSAASIVPFGVDDDVHVYAWLSVRDGRLRVEAPWSEFPAAGIEVPLLNAASDTVRALVDIGRLIGLLTAVDLDQVELVLPDEPTGPIALRAGGYEAVLMPADRWAQEREQLEELLCAFLGQESITADEDGDYPIDTPEGHRLWVRLYTDAAPVSVQVFSVLADNVEPTAGIFEELNSINSTAAHVKVLWATGAVMAEVDLVAGALAMPELENALNVVRNTAERYRDVLAAYFGTTADQPGSNQDGGTEAT